MGTQHFASLTPLEMSVCRRRNFVAPSVIREWKWIDMKGLKKTVKHKFWHWIPDPSF